MLEWVKIRPCRKSWTSVSVHHLIGMPKTSFEQISKIHNTMRSHVFIAERLRLRVSSFWPRRFVTSPMTKSQLGNP